MHPKTIIPKEEKKHCWNCNKELRPVHYYFCDKDCEYEYVVKSNARNKEEK